MARLLRTKIKYIKKLVKVDKEMTHLVSNYTQQKREREREFSVAKRPPQVKQRREKKVFKQIYFSLVD